jgi:hypothetical protein
MPERKVYEDEDYIVTRIGGRGRVYDKSEAEGPDDAELIEHFQVPGHEGTYNDDAARREFYRRFIGREW